MKKLQFLYPAIFIKNEDDSYQAIFPDLNIYCDGKTMSEAYLYAKDLLKAFVAYAVKYEIDFYKPSKYEDLVKKSRANETIMYVDALVEFEG